MVYLAAVSYTHLFSIDDDFLLSDYFYPASLFFEKKNDVNLLTSYKTCLLYTSHGSGNALEQKRQYLYHRGPRRTEPGQHQPDTGEQRGRPHL